MDGSYGQNQLLSSATGVCHRWKVMPPNSDMLRNYLLLCISCESPTPTVLGEHRLAFARNIHLHAFFSKASTPYYFSPVITSLENARRILLRRRHLCHFSDRAKCFLSTTRAGACLAASFDCIFRGCDATFSLE